MFSGSGRRIAALAACAPLLLVGACSDDPADGADPDPTPTDSGSASASPSASESASESPSPKPTKKYPEDKPAAEISAERVIHLWFQAYGQAINTGDTTRMRHMSGPGCRQCNQFANEIEDLEEAGGGIQTVKTPNKVIGTKLVEAKTPENVVYRVEVRVAGGRTVTQTGAEPIKFKAEVYEFNFVMSVRDDRWVVKQMGFAS